MIQKVNIFDAIAVAMNNTSLGRVFQNAVTGQGTSRDKSTAWEIGPQRFLSDGEKTMLWTFDYMARRLVDSIPNHATKKPFTIADDSKQDLTAQNDAIIDLQLVAHVRDAWTWARNYGGAAIVCHYAGREDTPAPEGEIPKMLEVVDKRFVTATGEVIITPEFYDVSNPLGGGNSRRIHKSRLMIFPGLKVPADISAQLGYWQESIHDLAIAALMSYHSAWNSAENLLNSSHQGVFKIAGFAKMVESQNREAALARIQIVDIYRSILRSIVVDKDGEDFEYKTAPLNGAADMMKEFRALICSVAKTPQTIMHGSSPDGMNATGESDFQIFSDTVDEERTTYLDPILRPHLVRWGAPKRFNFIWPPVWTPKPKDRADLRTAQYNADKTLVDGNLALPEEIMLFRKENGYDVDFVISDEGQAVRERDLLELYEKAVKTDETVIAGEEGTADTGTETGAVETESGVKVELAPTTIAKLMSANEARALLGLPPTKLPDGSLDPDGALPIDAYAESKMNSDNAIATPSTETGEPTTPAVDPPSSS